MLISGLDICDPVTHFYATSYCIPNFRHRDLSIVKVVVSSRYHLNLHAKFHKSSLKYVDLSVD